MKLVINSTRAPTDDAYCVSAAAVADKIIDRMQRGLDPLLIRRSMVAFVPASAGLGGCLQREPD
jgi:hypothetical protein